MENALVRVSSTDTMIQSRILTIRGVQVMLDRDLASLYGVETRMLNQAVKRNAERFPDDFMFKLTKEDCLRSQIVTLKEAQGKHLKYLPYVFTENGVAMLSSVLRSQMAIEINIRIMRAFNVMRRTLTSMTPVLARLEATEHRLLKQEDAQTRNEKRFEKIFDAMRDKKFPPQKIFFDGQFWDACSLVEKLIAKAKSSIVLIDNWVGPETLDLLAKKKKAVTIQVISSQRGNKLVSSDIEKFNKQYGSLVVKTSSAFHDRFLIIDDKELYLIGASLKDLGKKCFGFTKMDLSEIANLKTRI